MINSETIKSLYDDKPTLMRWLKKVEEALNASALASLRFVTEGEQTKLIAVFADGGEIASEPLDELTARRVTIRALNIDGGLILTEDANATFGGDVKINGLFEADSGTFESDVNVTGTARFYDNAGIGGNLNVAGNLNVDGNLTGANMPPRLFTHRISFVVNNDVNLVIRLVSAFENSFTSWDDVKLKRYWEINPSNDGSLFGSQFDLFYILDLNASPMAIRIFNMSNGRYDFSENVRFVEDSVLALKL